MLLDFSAPLTPPLAPNAEYVKAKKTPERIEFENSIDGLPEESEEELTEHNLRASLSRDAMLEEMYEEDLSDSDLEYVSGLYTVDLLTVSKGDYPFQ